MKQKNYETFLRLLRERKLLVASMSLLTWDEQVFLPALAAEGRAEQVSALAKVIHEKNTDPTYVELLRSLNGTELPEDARACVRETWKEVERSLLVPASLVGALTLAESEAFAAWVEAKKLRDYQQVKPHLEALVRLKQQYADCIRGTRSRYDSMLDMYEPGATAESIGTIFAQLAPELTALVAQQAKRTGERRLPFQDSFPVSEQERLCSEVAGWLGFDFTRGRLDISAHPFCSEIGFGDVRMTTRYSEKDFTRAFYGTLHETGHALYDLGYDARHRYTPLAEYCSMAIHESQSRLWENMVGRSRAFLAYLFPKLVERFPSQLSNVSFQTFYDYVNWVGPSFTRVEADEVSYGLHVILRFDLEQALFSGDLPFEDLPQAWNAAYKKYLGLTPADDGHGVLQDVHWYTGNFGYFPTYLLGSAYAAQLFDAVRKANPELDEQIARAEFGPLLSWLRTQVHVHGKRYSAHELIERATGKAPSSEQYLLYLKKKYS